MYPANLGKKPGIPFRFLPLDKTAYVYPPQDQLRENRVVDWLTAQKYADPGEGAYVTRRDLGLKRVEVSNSGRTPILVKITTDPETVVRWSNLTIPTHFQGESGTPRGMSYVRPSGQDFPGTSFVINPGTSRFIGVNPPEGPLQMCHILDPSTQIPIGQPIAIRHNLNILVAREGIQGWFFQAMKSTGFHSR